MVATNPRYNSFSQTVASRSASVSS